MKCHLLPAFPHSELKLNFAITYNAARCVAKHIDTRCSLFLFDLTKIHCYSLLSPSTFRDNHGMKIEVVYF